MSDAAGSIVWALVSYQTPTGERNFPGCFAAMPQKGDLIETKDVDSGTPLTLEVVSRKFRKPEGSPDEAAAVVLCKFSR